jgi:hypothetical protein
MDTIDDIGKTNAKGNIVKTARTVEFKFAEWLHHTNFEAARRDCNQVASCVDRFHSSCASTDTLT